MELAFETKDCFSDEMKNLEAIGLLDNICGLPCELAEVPDIPLDPDGNIISLPPITRRINVRRIKNFVAGCVPIGSFVSPADAAFADPINLSDPDAFGSEPDERDWTGGEGAIVVITYQLTRIVLDETALAMFGFFRQFGYNSCGELVYIGPEERKEIAPAEYC